MILMILVKRIGLIRNIATQEMHPYP